MPETMKRVKAFLQSRKRLHGIAYVAFIILLSSLSFWRVLTFDFWRDDWRLLCTIENPLLLPTLFHKIELHWGAWIENALLFPVFGWDPLWWHVFGIALRVVGAFAVAAMVFGLSRSKKIGALAGLFFAASFSGLEAIGWPSVHVASVVIIFLCTGVYFWHKYSYEKKIKNVALGFLLLTGAVLASPARSLPILVVLPFIEFFSWWTAEVKEALWRIAVRFASLSTILITVTLLLTSRLDVVLGINTDAGWYIQRLTQRPELLKNYFSTIGNLLFGWIVPIQESMGLVAYNQRIAIMALLVVIGGGMCGLVYGLRKKSHRALFAVFFLVWVLLFYVPGYLFFPTVIGGSHRYIAVAGVGLVGVMAFLVGSIKNTIVCFLTAVLFITLNVVTSNRILKKESTHRSFRVVENVLQNIVKDFPKKEHGSIVMLLGNPELHYSILEMPGSVAYAAKIHACGDYGHFFPTTDTNLIMGLLCDDAPKERQLGALPLPPSPVPLSKVHAWEIEGETIKNVSQREQERLREQARSRGCEPL